MSAEKINPTFNIWPDSKRIEHELFPNRIPVVILDFGGTLTSIKTPEKYVLAAKELLAKEINMPYEDYNELYNHALKYAFDNPYNVAWSVDQEKAIACSTPADIYMLVSIVEQMTLYYLIREQEKNKLKSLKLPLYEDVPEFVSSIHSRVKNTAGEVFKDGADDLLGVLLHHHLKGNLFLAIVTHSNPENTKNKILDKFGNSIPNLDKLEIFGTDKIFRSSEFIEIPEGIIIPEFIFDMGFSCPISIQQKIYYETIKKVLGKAYNLKPDQKEFNNPNIFRKTIFVADNYIQDLALINWIRSNLLESSGIKVQPNEMQTILTLNDYNLMLDYQAMGNYIPGRSNYFRLQEVLSKILRICNLMPQNGQHYTEVPIDP